ncbi:MAG: pyridoxamine 5'-phosphate oxidase family protein [Candidatus Heimdallarchaeota archaeon]|nr:pyridoxamine 5'-phosphate oxidase family protein [Candidatus Heimdallarchaeota archaeon]
MKLETVLDYFKRQPLMYLATTDGDRPRVRPVALIYHQDICWFVSISGRLKIKEIEKNNNVEFAINPHDQEDLSTIRGTGKAILIEDLGTKEDLVKAIPWFDAYWKAFDDPRFILYKLDLEQISIQMPIKRDIYTFSLNSGETQIREEK